MHGEVVAEGDWTVSDAERAAAGRETVTARFTALYREWAGGHDSWWWHTHLPLALAWLLTPGGSLAG